MLRKSQGDVEFPQHFDFSYDDTPFPTINATTSLQGEPTTSQGLYPQHGPHSHSGSSSSPSSSLYQPSHTTYPNTSTQFDPSSQCFSPMQFDSPISSVSASTPSLDHSQSASDSSSPGPATPSSYFSNASSLGEMYVMPAPAPTWATYAGPSAIVDAGVQQPALTAASAPDPTKFSLNIDKVIASVSKEPRRRIKTARPSKTSQPSKPCKASKPTGKPKPKPKQTRKSPSPTAGKKGRPKSIYNPSYVIKGNLPAGIASWKDLFDLLEGKAGGFTRIQLTEELTYYVCGHEDCDTKFERRADMRKHLVSHFKKPVLSCPIVGCTTELGCRESGMIRHLDINHGKNAEERLKLIKYLPLV